VVKLSVDPKSSDYSTRHSRCWRRRRSTWCYSSEASRGTYRSGAATRGP